MAGSRTGGGWEEVGVGIAGGFAGCAAASAGSSIIIDIVGVGVSVGGEGSMARRFVAFAVAIKFRVRGLTRFLAVVIAESLLTREVRYTGINPVASCSITCMHKRHSHIFAVHDPPCIPSTSKLFRKPHT